VIASASTADAVRELVPFAAAIAPRLAAELHEAVVLREGIEDHPGNQTRFVTLESGHTRVAGTVPATEVQRARKTALVFWGSGTDAPGWLVKCLDQFASRGVNLTRIESRPRREGFGTYMFFADVDGGDDEPAVAEAIAGLREHAETVRILGSFPAAPS
jgi:prephenate dehydratase